MAALLVNKSQAEHLRPGNGQNGVDLLHRTSSRSGITGEGLDLHPVGPADFDRATLLRVFRVMLSARRLDNKMLALLKQGKGFFHIGCSGHEAAQAAVALLSRPGHDWFAPYYRDLTLAMMLGQSIEETLLDHLSKANSPNSGGRQMPEHFSSRKRNVFSVGSSVGSQFLPALGMGLALMRQATDAYVLCSSGDGATSQGDFHEALNWATRSRAPVLFLVQDNKYAISVHISDQTAGGTPYKLAAGYEGLARCRVDGTDFFSVYAAAKAAITHIRQSKGPACLVADVVRLLPHSSSDNHLKYRTKKELEEDREFDPISRMEAALIEAGVFTAAESESIRMDIHRHVDEAAAWAVRQADPLPATATRHVYFEGAPPVTEEQEYIAGKPIVMVDAINHALHEEMEQNDKVLVYGEDVAGPKGGVFTATRNLTARFGEDRCFNSQLAEASIVGTAVGFAAAGYKPVVEIQFADYIWPAMQQLRSQVSSLRYRSNNAWSCPMVIRVPVGGYIHGGLCHSQNVESIFGHMPGFRVVLPSNAADAKGLLKTAIRCEDPVLFLEHKALYRSAAARSPEPDASYLLPFGRARICREGSDLTIVTYGYTVHKCLGVAQALAREGGASIEVIDLRTIVPVDMDTVIRSLRRTSRALVVHEDHEFIGFGAEICAQIADTAFEYLDAPVRRVASKLSYVAFADPLERAILPQEDDIAAAVRALLAY